MAQTNETCSQLREASRREIAQLRQEVANLKAMLDANSNESLRADVIELGEQVKRVRDALATGASMRQVSLSKQEYAAMADERIQAASLQEVVNFTNGDETGSDEDFETTTLQGRR